MDCLFFQGGVCVFGDGSGSIVILLFSYLANNCFSNVLPKEKGETDQVSCLKFKYLEFWS